MDTTKRKNSWRAALLIMILGVLQAINLIIIQVICPDLTYSISLLFRIAITFGIFALVASENAYLYFATALLLIVSIMLSLSFSTDMGWRVLNVLIDVSTIILGYQLLLARVKENNAQIERDELSKSPDEPEAVDSSE